MGLGILIGPLFPKHLFANFLFNHKVSGKKCKDGILSKLAFFLIADSQLTQQHKWALLAQFLDSQIAGRTPSDRFLNYGI